MTSQDSANSDRRSEERLEVEHDCVVEVRSPTWAMLSKPAEGLTSNLTLHGMKILLPDFSSVQYQTWLRRMDSEETISVSVRLTRVEGLEFEGDIAWCDFEESDGPRGMCTAGILLKVPSDAQAKAIRRILADRERESIDSSLTDEGFTPH